MFVDWDKDLLIVLLFNSGNDGALGVNIDPIIGLAEGSVCPVWFVIFVISLPLLFFVFVSLLLVGLSIRP